MRVYLRVLSCWKSQACSDRNTRGSVKTGLELQSMLRYSKNKLILSSEPVIE